LVVVVLEATASWTSTWVKPPGLLLEVVVLASRVFATFTVVAVRGLPTVPLPRALMLEKRLLVEVIVAPFSAVARVPTSPVLVTEEPTPSAETLFPVPPVVMAVPPLVAVATEKAEVATAVLPGPAMASPVRPETHVPPPAVLVTPPTETHALAVAV
jgi:hypothetical protein